MSDITDKKAPIPIVEETGPKVILEPRVTFTLGDKRFQSLYGPENAEGERPLVGFIDTSQTERLEAMLEYADAHMTEEDR